MSDTEIIKEATEAYNQNLDAGCYVGDLLNIIKQQKNEIERLHGIINKLVVNIAKMDELLPLLKKEIKADTIEEFAELLQKQYKVRYITWNGGANSLPFENIVENFLKEKVGNGNA